MQRSSALIQPLQPPSCQWCGEDSINPSCSCPPSPLRSERLRELKFTHVCPRGNHLSVAQCAKDPLSPKLLRNLYLPVMAPSPSLSFSEEEKSGWGVWAAVSVITTLTSWHSTLQQDVMDATCHQWWCKAFSALSAGHCNLISLCFILVSTNDFFGWTGVVVWRLEKVVVVVVKVC